MCELRAAGARGSIVTLLCDGGERYRNTYKSDAWLAEQGLDLAPYSDTAAGGAGDRKVARLRRESSDAH